MTRTRNERGMRGAARAEEKREHAHDATIGRKGGERGRVPSAWDSIELGGKAHIWAGLQGSKCSKPGTGDVPPEKGEHYRPTCANER